ncbi:hypothetical protein ACSMXN_01230 [Jatrophihabitans sp. DSM 45814]
MVESASTDKDVFDGPPELVTGDDERRRADLVEVEAYVESLPAYVRSWLAIGAAL